MRGGKEGQDEGGTVNSYAILSSETIHSTLWSESDKVKLLFITMLCLKNRDGIVVSSTDGLAHASRYTLEDTKAALLVLESPDTKDPTQEHEGRRIKKVEGGWLILNHRKYLEKAKALSKRAYDTEWARENRAKKRKSGDRTKTGGSLRERLAIADEQAQTQAVKASQAQSDNGEAEDKLP